MNASEPLGLPRGSVRAILALAVVGCAVYLFGTGQGVSVEFVAFSSPVIAWYFAARQAENAANPPKEPVPAPVLGAGD